MDEYPKKCQINSWRGFPVPNSQKLSGESLRKIVGGIARKTIIEDFLLIFLENSFK